MMPPDRSESAGRVFHGMHPHLLKRYLRLLGISVLRPDYETLASLIRAHLWRVPFENISKLYYRRRLGLRSLPALELFLDGIEHFGAGGTCYSTNYYFKLLLDGLGYDVILCAADMSAPDVHLVSMVTLDGRQYLVDVGYGAPFLDPLPRDSEADHEIRLGRERYLLKPSDHEGRSMMEMYLGERLVHQYVAKPESRSIHEFEQVIRDSHSDEAAFMTRIVLSRYSATRSVVIRDLSVTETDCHGQKLRTLTGREELEYEVQTQFGIPMHVTRAAIDELEGNTGHPLGMNPG